MPVGYLTSSTLIETVKREGMIPTSQNTYSDSDFLAIANQEVRVSMLPSIMQYHEEYYARDSEPVTLIANQNNYAIPYRAVGGKFREVFYKDTSGNLSVMTRISPDDRPYYQQSNFQNRFIYFYIEGNEVVLVPNVQDNPVGSLVFSFYMRPNELVDESRIATIIAITVDSLAGTTTLTVDNTPKNLTTFTQNGVTLTGFSINSSLDIMQTRPGHKTISYDVFPTNVNNVANTITFNTSDLDSSIIIGDYISFSGECMIPQIPADLHDILVQRVVQKCVQGLGDSEAFKMSSARLVEMEKNTGMLVDNRSEGQPKKANNLKSPLRWAKVNRRRWI